MLRIGGFLRLAMWRLRRGFSSRRRATLVVVLALFVVGGLSFWKSDRSFRAEEDQTEEVGFDYVEHVSMEKFRKGLDQIPGTTLSFEAQAELITKLAGADYFRLSTVEERQALLATLDLSNAEEDIVRQIESGSEGSWAWLDWLLPYCEQDRDGASVDSGIAHAQTRKCNPALTEKKKDFIQERYNTAGEREVSFAPAVISYIEVWRGFFQEAITSEHCRNEPGLTNLVKERVFFKECWKSSTLDTIYKKYWPDLKLFRDRLVFSKEEVRRIDTALRLKEQYDRKIRDEQFIEGLQWYGELIVSVLPFEKAVSVPLKLGTKALEIMATSRRAAPWAYGVAIQVSRNGKKVANFITHFGQEIQLNVTTAFRSSKIFGSSALKVGSVTVGEWQSLVLTRAFEGANSIISKAPLGEAVRKDMERRLLESLSKVRVVNARQIAKVRGESRLEAKVGLAFTDTGETWLNEEYFLKLLKSKNYNAEQAAVHMQKTFAHEFNHHLSRLAIGGRDAGYSKKLRYSPVEEGFTEYLAQKQTRESISVSLHTYIPNSYPDEVEIADSFRHMLKRKYLRQGLDNSLAGIEADKTVSELYYVGLPHRRDLTSFEELILDGIPPNSSFSQTFSGTEPYRVLRWITEKWETNKNEVFHLLEDVCYQ